MIRLLDLLGVRRLGLRLVACRGSEATWLRWAQPVDDLLDVPRVSGGDLVVTTGRWRRSPGDAERLACALVNRGAAALAVEAPDERFRLDELAIACERWRLPLLTIARGASAVSVAEAAVTMVVDRRGAQLLNEVQRQGELLRLLGGAGLPGLLDAMGRHLGCPVWLLRTGALIGPADAPSFPDDLLPAVIDSVSAESGDGPIELAGAAPVVAFRLDGKRAGRPASALICMGLPEVGRDETRAAIDHGLPFLERECAMASGVRAARRGVAGEFLRRLTAEDSTGDELAAWARALGVEPRGHVTCITARARDAAPGGAQQMAEGIEDLADRLGVPRIVVDQDDEASAFLFLGEADTATERVIAGCAGVLERQLLDRNLTLGTSSVIASDIGDIVSTLHDARRVCELNRLRGAQAQPAQPERAVSLAAFLLAGDANARSALHASLLAPLIAYDERHGSDLVRTLDVFLSHTGGWSASAGELGVHVNTLRYRLARIEKFTGRDLSSMADRVDFYLALQAWQAQREEADVRALAAHAT